MKYLESKRSQFAGINEFYENYSTRKLATEHPQYPMFKTQLMTWGLADDIIQKNWKLLVDGIVMQNELNRIATLMREIGDVDFHRYCAYDADYETICINIFRTIPKVQDKLAFYQSVIKSSNEFYLKFADNLKRYLLTNGKELALWSGGYDLSSLSNKFGKCPLEQTKLGELLDKLPLTTNWQLEAPLWNIISRTFVRVYEGKNVHAYMRTVDKESVLLRQEIPMLERLGKIIHWHILFNNGTYLSEIGRRKVTIDGQEYDAPDPVEAGAFKSGWGTSQKAFEMLAEQLKVAQSKTNSRAIDQVLYKEFPKYRIPFGFYE